MKTDHLHSVRVKVYVKVYLIVMLAGLYSACRVTMVAPYDEKIAQQIGLISKKIDKLYLTMLEIPDDNPSTRAYALFTEKYIDIEVDLNALLLQNRLRPLNKESTRNSEIALETWMKYKEKHKEDNTISDFDIDLNRDFFRDLFMVLLVGEEVRKNINN